VDHAGDVIEGFVIERNPRVAGAGEGVEKCAEICGVLDRDNVGARHHHVMHSQIGKGDEVEHHRPRFGANALLGSLRFVIFGCAFGAVAIRAEEGLEPMQQAFAMEGLASTGRVGVAHC
jgi:hypothetical protein